MLDNICLAALLSFALDEVRNNIHNLVTLLPHAHVAGMWDGDPLDFGDVFEVWRCSEFNNLINLTIYQ